jgi:homoserine O-acetyltransferase/O-succinyltransferase
MSSAVASAAPRSGDGALLHRPPSALNPHTKLCSLHADGDPFVLLGGERLEPVQIAYETYGTLDRSATNGVFVCHALTGDAHVARHADDDEPGWWDVMVGPGCPIDTDRHFVICANVLGGCSGTTGPWSATRAGRPYGLDFPEVHVRDITSLHRTLTASLGIRRLHAVIGGSLGGMQALDWFLQAPEEAEAFLLIAASAQLSAENLAWHAVGRAAIRSDPDFQEGRYLPHARPDRGLGVARMVAHLTYLCEHSLEAKFGRQLTRAETAHASVADGPFSVEAYLEHQADKLARRFDANSYLYLTRAMDSYEPFTMACSPAVRSADARVELFSFDDDRLFGSAHSAFIERELARLGARRVRHHRERTRTIGHDAFLAYTPTFLETMRRRLMT